MIKVGDIISIVDSLELRGCGLDELTGRTGMILEDLSGNRASNKGYWVRVVGDALYGENEWFIPADSVTKPS